MHTEFYLYIKRDDNGRFYKHPRYLGVLFPDYSHFSFATALSFCF